MRWSCGAKPLAQSDQLSVRSAPLRHASGGETHRRAPTAAIQWSLDCKPTISSYLEGHNHMHWNIIANFFDGLAVMILLLYQFPRN